MIIRHLMIGAPKFLATLFLTNEATAYTVSSITFKNVVRGEPGSIVTFKVSLFEQSYGGASFSVDGITYALNDTFTRMLDSTGQVSFVQVLNVGTSNPGNAINVQLSIVATSIGAIGLPSFIINDKTT